MAKILPFRIPGQCCSNCRNYVPERELMQYYRDDLPGNYCNHPDYTSQFTINSSFIEILHLQRDPESWKELVRDTMETVKYFI